MTDHFELSTITGTVAMSGSAAIRRRKRVIAATPSSIASSMLTSMSWAPLSTCSRAMSTASSSRPVGDEPGELARAGHVRPLTDVDESVARRRDDQGFEARQAGDPVGSGISRGGRPATAAAMAATWAGVDPQQLPATLSRPWRAHSPSASAISSGVSS